MQRSEDHIKLSPITLFKRDMQDSVLLLDKRVGNLRTVWSYQNIKYVINL